MNTDSIFHALFRDHPDWLRQLTGLPLPAGCRGASRVLKELEIRCDLLLEPSDPDDPFYLVEFQLYLDHFNLLLQRFKSKDLNEIREMIGELTPIHETRAGQQLLEEGLQKGLREGRQEALAAMVRRMASKGRSPAEISEWTDLPIDEVEGLLGAEGE